MMIIIAEFFVVILKVLLAFLTAGAKWIVRPKEKSVAGQVCLITGAGSGLGRLFAKEFARRRAILVLWDINSQSNEETAEMVRQIYHELDTPITKDGKSVFFAAFRLPPGSMDNLSSIYLKNTHYSPDQRYRGRTGMENIDMFVVFLVKICQLFHFA